MPVLRRNRNDCSGSKAALRGYPKDVRTTHPKRTFSWLCR